MFWGYSKLIIALILVGGGVALMIGALSRKSSTASWAKKALFFSGLSALTKGILSMTKIFYAPSITAQHLKLIERYGIFLGGLTLGILLTLFISGELSFKKMKKAKIEDNKNEAKT
jgi:hypothetical protein